MSPQLITFDAYAALCDYRSSLLPAVEAVAGIGADRACEFLELWRARQLAAAALSNALGRERIPFRECTARALDYTLHRFDAKLDADGRDALVRAWYPLVPWPEANEVLSALKTRGHLIAMLSNGDRDMLGAIAARLDTPFDHIFSSEQCGVYKPHPDIYALPARQLGITDYLHVAGSGNDVIGARSAGIRCYWSNRSGDRVLLDEFAPDGEGTDLRGLLGFI